MRFSALMRCRPAAIAAVAVAVAITLGAPFPSAAASVDLRGYDQPSGGRIFFGFVPGATSGVAVLRSGLERAQRVFQDPVVLAAVGSKDGRLALAVFKGGYQGARIGGLVVANYDVAGVSHVAFLFDRVERLRTTMAPMERALGVITARAIDGIRRRGGDPQVQLVMHDFPDGTGRAGVAPGYDVKIMEAGRFSVVGSDGAYLNVGNPLAMLDPRGSLYAQMARMSSRYSGSVSLPAGTLVAQYTRDIGAGWVSARRQMARQNGQPDPYINITQSRPLALPGDSSMIGSSVQGTHTVNGIRMGFVGTFLAHVPDASGNWLITVTVLSAPLSSYSRDMPVLSAMQHSLQLNLQALTAQTNATIAASARALAQTMSADHAAYMQMSEAKFQSVMARERASQQSIDRSAAGFNEYINGTTWVRDSGSGRDYHVDQNLGYSLVRADPGNFTELPISAYTPGVHY